VVNDLEHDEWYSDIIYYLHNLSCPDHLVDYKRRDLRLKAMKYCPIENGLGWKDPDGVLLRCVNQEEAEKLLKNYTLYFVVDISQLALLPNDPKGWILLAITIF
jgi:hypothetical protein